MLVDQVEFRVHAAICALLVLKLVINALAIGAVRVYQKSWVQAEDASTFRGEVRLDASVERLRRLHLNSLENELPYMIVGLLFVLVGTPLVGIQAYGYTFLLTRLAHAGFYLGRLQPFRSLAWGVGTLCLIGMSVQVLMASFR
jgi:uncharacterized MAPEG superfamily protein